MCAPYLRNGISTILVMATVSECLDTYKSWRVRPPVILSYGINCSFSSSQIQMKLDMHHQYQMDRRKIVGTLGSITWSPVIPTSIHYYVTILHI